VPLHRLPSVAAQGVCKPRPYQLRSLLFCGLCDRRMQGNWNHGIARYRCRYPNEYALANNVGHPRTVYLREDQIVPSLDRWVSRIFKPENIEQTLDRLAEAQPDPDAENMADRAALAACDKKLVRYRAALEAGTHPVLIAEWTSQVKAERSVIEGRQRPRSSEARRLTRDEIQVLVSTLTDLAHVIDLADPRDKALLYHQLGLRLTYHPNREAVLVEARPATASVCVRNVSEGGLEPPRSAMMRTMGAHALILQPFHHTAECAFRRRSGGRSKPPRAGHRVRLLPTPATLPPSPSGWKVDRCDRSQITAAQVRMLGRKRRTSHPRSDLPKRSSLCVEHHLTL